MRKKKMYGEISKKKILGRVSYFIINFFPLHRRGYKIKYTEYTLLKYEAISTQ